MPIHYRSVTSSKNTIRFGARFDDRALAACIIELEDVSSRGHRDIILDFRRCEVAYPESMLPLIALLDAWRDRGATFRLILPTDAAAARLFINARWACLIDESHPDHDIGHPQHLSVRRYVLHPEQQDAVRAATDIVLRNLSLRRDLLQAVEWTVNEITDNVLNHAESPRGGLVQVSTFTDSHLIKLVVADGGRGIPAAMRLAYPRLSDFEAITEAMKPGVTSPPDAGQGNGLAGSVRIARFAEGSFKILSGRAKLSVFRDPRTGEYRTQRGESPRGHKFTGTTVMVELSTTAQFDIAEALELDGSVQHQMVDVVDLAYTGAEGNLTIRVCDEDVGVGTRHAGAELRRKALNLLVAEPTRRLVFDWCGLALISSSFADEAVGKLFVELGPTRFASRVTHANTEPLVASLLDRAVMQRVVQQMGGTTETPPELG
jgi:anti-sigma regulatory factor (Ser/Thr protein kinase)